MLKLQMPRKVKLIVPPGRKGGRPQPHRRVHGSGGPRFDSADLKSLVDCELISRIELEQLEREQEGSGDNCAGIIDAAQGKGICSQREIERCLETQAWHERSAREHVEHTTSEQTLSACRHEFALNGICVVRHALPRDLFIALDVAAQRLSLSHVAADPIKHKLYDSIGGQALLSDPTIQDVLGHAAVLELAKSLLGGDLVMGKPFLKVDDPHRCRATAGHTHAERWFDALSRTVHFCLFLDAISHDSGGLQVVPGSHGWYAGDAKGRAVYQGRLLEESLSLPGATALTHDAQASRRWAGYETLNLPANSLVAMSPFVWHAVRPVHHRRRVLLLNFFDAGGLTREFVMHSEYFGEFPYDLGSCDLSSLGEALRAKLAIHLDRERWLRGRGL